MGVGAQRHAPAILPRERPGTPCIGGWIEPSAGLNGWAKSHPPPYRDLIPGPSSPQTVAIPTELSRPTPPWYNRIEIAVYAPQTESSVQDIHVHVTPISAAPSHRATITWIFTLRTAQNMTAKWLLSADPAVSKMR